MNVQELVTKYTFEMDTKPLENVQNKVSDLVGFMAKLGAAGAVAAGTVFAWTKATAQAGDEALATSQKLGMTVEKLTAFQFAAKQSNLEAASFNTGMRFLSRNMFAASTGSEEAMKAFSKLGVSVKDASGKLLPTDEVLLSLADKFKAMPGGAQKTALAMGVFGKAGADIIPMLNEGSAGIQTMLNRADELGITLSTELAQAGDTFNDSMDEMLGALTGVRNLVGGQLLPILTPLIKKITEWFVANRKVVASKLESFLKLLISAATGVYNIFNGVYRMTLGLSRVFGGMENMAKALGAAFLLFAGAKILYMIGTLVMGLTTLASSIMAVNVSALLIPALIGAAIALLALLIEDVYTFFTDPQAQTFTKDLIDGLKSLWNTLSGLFSSMGAWGQILINVILTPFRAVINAMKNMVELFDMMRGKTSLSQGLSNIMGNVKNLYTGSFGGGGTLSEAIGLTPSASPANTSTALDQSMQNKMSVVNNINVGAGADPTQVGKSVQAGTQEGIDGALRGVQRSYGKQGAY